MARAPKTETAEVKDGAEATVETQHNGTTVITFDPSMAELTMARRLYDIWATVGGLTDVKWEWSRQTERAHAAWIAVARAASPPVLAKHWTVTDLADVLHG